MSEGKFTLIELCECSALDEQFVIACVEHGVAPTSGTQVVEWIFSQTAVLRLQKAWRLHRDLDLQIDSLPLVLELLDERDQLLQEIAALRQHLRHWEHH
jgi:chaperone modulatory protein CbpM